MAENITSKCVCVFIWGYLYPGSALHHCWFGDLDEKRSVCRGETKRLLVCMSVCACVFWGESRGWGGWGIDGGDNDKHHLSPLIVKVHQSTVRPVCLKQPFTDGWGPFAHTTDIYPPCLRLLYHFRQRFIFPPNFQPCTGHLRALLLYKQAWANCNPSQQTKAPSCGPLLSLRPFLSPSPHPGLNLSGDEGLRRNRPSEELPA